MISKGFRQLLRRMLIGFVVLCALIVAFFFAAEWYGRRTSRSSPAELDLFDDQMRRLASSDASASQGALQELELIVSDIDAAHSSAAALLETRPKSPMMIRIAQMVRTRDGDELELFRTRIRGTCGQYGGYMPDVVCTALRGILDDATRALPDR